MVSSDHALKHGFSVSEELSGHGIGEEFHCLPLILHHSKFSLNKTRHHILKCRHSQ